MLASIPAQVFLEWMAYAKIEPWGEVRADLRAGMVVATLHNLFTKGPRRKAEDFILVPQHGKSSKAITDPAKIQALLKGMAGIGIGTWQSKSSET